MEKKFMKKTTSGKYPTVVIGLGFSAAAKPFSYYHNETYFLEFRLKKDLSILEKGRGGFLVIKKRRVNSVEVKYYTAEDTAPVIIRARLSKVRSLDYKTLKIRIDNDFKRGDECSIVSENGISVDDNIRLKYFTKVAIW